MAYFGFYGIQICWVIIQILLNLINFSCFQHRGLLSSLSLWWYHGILLGFSLYGDSNYNFPRKYFYQVFIVL